MIGTSPRRSTAAATRGAGRVASARRLPHPLRKAVLAAHILVAVGWFGIVVAKLILEIWAAASQDREASRGAYVFMQVLDGAIFPPAAIGTLVTGVILSVGTPWGLFQHYWIVVKLVLAVAVVLTGVLFVGAWVQEAAAAASGLATDVTTTSRFESASRLLIGAAVAHALMLGAATVISVFKPWGRIRTDRDDAARGGARASANPPV